MLTCLSSASCALCLSIFLTTWLPGMRAVDARLASAVSTSMGKVNQQLGTPTPPFTSLPPSLPSFSPFPLTPLRQQLSRSCWESRRTYRCFTLDKSVLFWVRPWTGHLVIKQNLQGGIHRPFVSPSLWEEDEVKWRRSMIMWRPLVAMLTFNMSQNVDRKKCNIWRKIHKCKRNHAYADDFVFYLLDFCPDI